jgi:hypothetical protein
MENKCRIYLDDFRIPLNVEDDPLSKYGDWILVKNYDEFTAVVESKGLENIGVISLDHDLDESAMQEYFNNVSPHYTLDYSNINEKTGMDCAKWLVEKYYESYVTSQNRGEKRLSGITFPQVYVHSANPIGSGNIMGYINNFLMNEGQPQSCIRVQFLHT